MIQSSLASTPGVLIVDDDRATRAALAEALDGLGARIVQASSGDDALRHALREHFAVIVLDVELPPGIDGFAVANLMRERERSRATPIIFVTARDSDRRTTLAGHESGAVDVLYKPLDLGLVRAKIGVFLELDRLRNESAAAALHRDANERLRATVAELEDARLHAEASQRAKDQFVATMSHEIRTPINAILGYAQLLELGLAGPVSDQQRAYLDRLNSSSRHLLELVNDILDLAKIDAGEMTVDHEAAWTGPIVAASLELVASQAEAAGITLIDNRAGEAGEPFVGDVRRVRQILANLLSNAVKFTPRGGAVTVSCERAVGAAPSARLHGDGPWTAVSVQDTGIGIAADEQSLIFEPFHQVDRGHTRTRGGTGLGLGISRRLARLMGGDLTVASVPGKGSTFTLWLPASQPGETEDARTRRAAGVPLARGLYGMAEIGEALRDEVQTVVLSYAARLRSDPATPCAASHRQADVEDHQVTLLADIAQSLIMLSEAEEQASDLLTDATEIQRVVAERHGVRRQRQGWTEASVVHDFQNLLDETVRVIRSRVSVHPDTLTEPLAVVERLIERAREISLRAWREAAKRPE